MTDSFPTVRDIGEQGLLKQLQAFCPADIVGDDAAVLSLAPNYQLVVTTDVLVDGVHFSDRTTSPQDVGWRAAAANLSDLAAMGATPLGITVGLSLPGEVRVKWVKQLYEGMTECLQGYQTPIIGGDICRSPVITVNITALGQVKPQRIIRRSTAQVGDVILVTGYHGASKAGLELLLHPELAQNLAVSQKKALINAHQRPKPRLDVPPLLWELSETVTVTGMDSSDGLADAVVQICHLSGVGAVIERSKVSIPDALKEWLSPQQTLDWALYGGEDFELVLCLPETLAEALLKQLSKGAAIIGKITSGTQVEVVDSQGNYPNREFSLEEGFQHFKKTYSPNM